MRLSRTRGFTLMELIVVLLVVGIIALIAAPVYQKVQENALSKVVETNALSIARDANAMAAFTPGAPTTSVEVEMAAKEAYRVSDLADIGPSAGAILTGTVSAPQLRVQARSGSWCKEATVTVPATVAAMTDGAHDCTTGGGSGPVAAPVVTAQARDGAVDLSWTNPGSTVTDYLISYSDDGGTTWTPYADGVGTGLSVTVPGLANGTSYQFQVIAVDASGPGDPGTAAAMPRGPMTLDYPLVSLHTGTDLDSLTPTVTNMYVSDGPPEFTTPDTLPPGVTLDPDTGDITGPPASQWYVKAAQVSSAQQFSAAVDNIGQVWTWGYNNQGQLGNGTLTNLAVPGKVTTTGTPMAGKTITSVAAGQQHVLAVDSAGTVYAWGDNAVGQVGDGTTTDRTTAVAVNTTSTPMSGKTITQVAAGNLYSMALDNSGAVYTWGQQSFGVLGAGAVASRTQPGSITQSTGILAGHTISAIAASGQTAFALAENGRMYAWGYGASGNRGDGTTNATQNVPVAVDWTGVLAGKQVVQMAAGENHVLVLADDGNLYAWGLGTSGQLGTGATTSSSVPVAVTMTGFDAPIASIGAGANDSYAVTTSGTAYAWGANTLWQVGDGTTTQRNTPTAVTASGALAGKALTRIDGGLNYGVAIDTNGKLYGWGANSLGQVGDATTTSRSTPVTVSGQWGPQPGLPVTVHITVTTSGGTATTTIVLSQTP